MLKVLIVDDSQDDALFMVRLLREGGYDVVFSRVETSEDMAAALSSEEWHLVLSDYEMPQFDGLRALELFKGTFLDIPFIVVSGAISEDVAVELMKGGAHDYIAKGNLSRLAPAVERELQEARLRAENRGVEDALHESEELCRMAIESSSDGFILVSVDDKVISYVNRRFLDIFGYDGFSELTGVSLPSLIHPEDRQFMGFYMDRRRTAGGVSTAPLYECRGVGRDGAVIALEMSVAVMVSKGVEAYVIHIRDVTDRKKSELEQSRLFNLSLDMLGIWGFDGYFRQLNPAWTRSLGWARGELMSRPYLEFIHPQDRLATMNAVRKLAEDDAPLSFENRYLAKDGSYRWLLWNTYPLKSEGVVFSVARDVTEKKHAAEEMAKTLKELRKSADAAIDVVARAVEVRDPYTSGHQKRVARLAAAIAGEMGLMQGQVEAIYMAGSIHDLGMISVPAAILSMPRKLVDVEFNFIKTHPRVGYDILKNISFEWPIADIVYEHHERMDGSGYPRGLTEKDIRPESRVVAVADVVEAIESHRPYRPALGREAALDEILENRGILYDAGVVDACCRLYREKGFVLEEHE